MCTEKTKKTRKTKHVQKSHHPRKTPPTKIKKQTQQKPNTKKHKKLILFYCRKKHSFLQQKQSEQIQ